MGNMQDNPCKWIRGGSLMWDLYREFEEDDEVYSMLDVVKTTSWRVRNRCEIFIDKINQTSIV